MSFSQQIKEQALVSCARHCCICHRFVGLKIECHHIVHKSKGGEDTIENCIPLCFDCHADMISYDNKHPKGTKYSQTEIKSHRDNWYKKVSDNNQIYKYNEISRNADKELFCNIVKKITFAMIENLANRNFGHEFKMEILYPFFELVDDSFNPDMEFFDPEIESLRSELLNSIKKFSNLIGQNTWRIKDNPGYNSVPREWQSDGQFERFERVTKAIHDSTNDIKLTYDKFYRTTRRKLPDWKTKST